MDPFLRPSRIPKKQRGRARGKRLVRPPREAPVGKIELGAAAAEDLVSISDSRRVVVDSSLSLSLSSSPPWHKLFPLEGRADAFSQRGKRGEEVEREQLMHAHACTCAAWMREGVASGLRRGDGGEPPCEGRGRGFDARFDLGPIDPLIAMQGACYVGAIDRCHRWRLRLGGNRTFLRVSSSSILVFRDLFREYNPFFFPREKERVL